MEFLTKTSYINSMKELSSSENSKFVIYPAEMPSGNTNAMEKINEVPNIYQSYGI